MANFKPSDVFAFFPNSSFRKKEKEVLTAHIVRLLATEGDSWDKVVEWRLLLEHTRSAKMPHSGYENPFKKISLGERCGNAIWVLEETGFVEWVEKGKTFKITQKLVDFYEPYALVELTLAE